MVDSSSVALSVLLSPIVSDKVELLVTMLLCCIVVVRASVVGGVVVATPVVGSVVVTTPVVGSVVVTTPVVGGMVPRISVVRGCVVVGAEVVVGGSVVGRGMNSVAIVSISNGIIISLVLPTNCWI